MTFGGPAMHDMTMQHHDMDHMDHGAVIDTTPRVAGQVIEYPLAWPGAAPTTGCAAADSTHCCVEGGGSTHELVYDRQNGGKVFWVSGQNYDHIARVTLDGQATYFAMPQGSLPHGIKFDLHGQLWVTFEGHGQLARITEDGTIAQLVDVCLHGPGIDPPINTRPHGLGIGLDGALWFTGKLTNTVGRVDPVSFEVRHYALPTLGAVPIYLSAAPDGAMWCTELTSSRIARIPAEGGAPVEIAIPTANSRPIAIVPGPDGRMWFSEEAGGKVGRVEADGSITEFPVPLTAANAILAGLAFDDAGNLWVQQYVSPPPTGPVADDYIVRLSADILHAEKGDLSGVDVRYYRAPSRGTVMHRITQGPDGDIWFSELGINRIGKVRIA